MKRYVYAIAAYAALLSVAHTSVRAMDIELASMNNDVVQGDRIFGSVQVDPSLFEIEQEGALPEPGAKLARKKLHNDRFVRIKEALQDGKLTLTIHDTAGRWFRVHIAPAGQGMVNISVMQATGRSGLTPAGIDLFRKSTMNPDFNPDTSNLVSWTVNSEEITLSIADAIAMIRGLIDQYQKEAVMYFSPKYRTISIDTRGSEIFGKLLQERLEEFAQ